jgi:hypothetical protein
MLLLQSGTNWFIALISPEKHVPLSFFWVRRDAERLSGKKYKSAGRTKRDECMVREVWEEDELHPPLAFFMQVSKGDRERETTVNNDLSCPGSNCNTQACMCHRA